MKTSKKTISTFCLINHIPIHGERNKIMQQLASDSPLTHQSQPSNHTRDLSSKALRQQKIWSTKVVTPRQPNRDGRTPSTGAWLRPFTRVFVVGDSFTRTTKKDGEGKNKVILITHLWSTKHPCYVSYNQTRNIEPLTKKKEKKLSELFGGPASWVLDQREDRSAWTVLQRPSKEFGLRRLSGPSYSYRLLEKPIEAIV